MKYKKGIESERERESVGSVESLYWRLKSEGMSAGCIKYFLSLSSLSYQDSVQSVNCLAAVVSVYVCVL